MQGCAVPKKITEDILVVGLIPTVRRPGIVVWLEQEKLVNFVKADSALMGTTCKKSIKENRTGGVGAVDLFV